MTQNVNMIKIANHLKAATLNAVKSDNSQDLISSDRDYAGFVLNLTKALECFNRVKDTNTPTL